MKSSARTRTHPLRLQPGLAVLRYTSGDSRHASTIQLEPNPAVTAMREPSADNLDLERIGQCLVLRITAPTSVVLRNVPHAGQSAASVGVTLEYLTPLQPQHAAGGGLAGEAGRTPGRRAGPSPASPALSIVGHVSRLGDRRVASGEWLAGPDRPLPIEGLAMQFSEAQPKLHLRYYASDSVDRFDPRNLVEGIFSGTRGKARSIRQVFLSLDGEDREYYRLSVDAMFLGSPMETQIGTDLRLQSQTGKEPLVGLRLAIIHTMEDPSGRTSRHSDGSGAGVLVF